MSNTVKSYTESVHKQLQIAGASSSLATSLVTVHADFIASALERERPADRLARIILSTHRSNIKK